MSNNLFIMFIILMFLTVSISIAIIVGIVINKDKKDRKHLSKRQHLHNNKTQKNIRNLSNSQYPIDLYENEDIREQEAFGKLGEKRVADFLSEIKKQYGGYVFNNFTFEDENGYSTNIDHILICKGGIFVIETKSNKGVVFCDVNQDQWYAKKENNDYKTLKNPIKQNEGHINHLKRIMGDKPPKMLSIVIFPVADYIENKSTIVHTLDSARKYIIDKITHSHYSDPERFIKKSYEKLKQIKNKYGISIEKHMNNLKKMYAD